jgi:hypothetical protein
MPAPGTDRTGPDRVVERGGEQSDHGGVDSAQGGLTACTRAECFPIRQRADEDQHAGKKNADQCQRGTRDAVRRRPHDSTKIRRKREERPGERLRRAVAGEKRIVADPSWRDHKFFTEISEMGDWATEGTEP